MAPGFSAVPEVVVVKGFLQGGLSVESVTCWLAAWLPGAQQTVSVRLSPQVLVRSLLTRAQGPI